MKLKIVLFLSLMVSFTAANAQVKTAVEDYIRVWGFLKYHHPVVAQGALDWDAEFIARLPQVESARTPEAINAFYVQWLDQLGEGTPCVSCPPRTVDAKSGSTRDAFDASDTAIDPVVTQRLNALAAQPYAVKNAQVQYHSKTGLPLFNKEQSFDADELPNRAVRLLALARYWNAVAYFYPYKNLMSQSWNFSLNQALPLFHTAATAYGYQYAIAQVTKLLEDSNAFVASDLLYDAVGRNRLPYQLQANNDKWYITKALSDADDGSDRLQLGDELLLIDQKPLGELVQERSQVISASNKRVLQATLASSLLNGVDTLAQIQVLRNADTLNLQVKRYAVDEVIWSDTDLLAWKSLNKQTLLVVAKNLEFDHLRLFETEMRAFKNVVVDLRSYDVPTGLKLLDYLLTQSKVYAQMVQPDPRYIGNFNRVKKQYERSAQKLFFPGRIIVLVDEKTRGQAELLALALKGRDRIELLGTATAGTLGYNTKLVLPGDVVVFFTGLGVENADGSAIQKTGVEPDVLLSKFEVGAPLKNDRLLDRALEMLQGN